MKRLLMLTVILVSGLLVGCGGSSTESDSSALLRANGHNGLLEEADVRQRRKDNIHNINRRAMVDDWDGFWLLHRSSMMTSHIVRVGY